MSEYNIQMNKYNALNAEYDQLYPQPMKHASTHAKDGDDPITPSSIGAAELGADGKVLTSQLPSMEVDAYTKAQTLSDTTKSLFGLSSDAVPDNVLEMLSPVLTHYWNRRTYSAGYEQILTTLNAPSLTNAFEERTIYYSDSVNFDSNGNPSLVNEKSISLSNVNYSTVTPQLTGKYLRNTWYGVNNGDAIIYISKDASFGLNSGIVSVSTGASKVSSQWGITVGEWEQLSSPDKNAYPLSGVHDGYEYQYVGMPLENAKNAPKIATGSYTGTGTYGASNKTSLTFDFQPSVIFIGATTNSNRYAEVGVIIAKVAGYKIKGGQYGIISSVTGNTVSFYAEEDASNQFNTSEITYYYIAIG